MDRDEILKRSREQKEDEGVTYMDNRGKKYGVIGLSAMFFLLAAVYIFMGGNNLLAPFSMMCAYQGAENLGKYSANKAKENLIWGIIATLGAVGCFLAHVLVDVMGVVVY